MSTLDAARATQLANIEKRTGKTLEELSQLIKASGLEKHGQIRDMLMREVGLGFGDATQLVHFALATDGQTAAEKAGLTTTDVIDGLYTGAKAVLRPIHDKLMTSINTFGEYEIVPKKDYISLRRKRQFAMIGPATNTRVEVGINAKELPQSERLLVMKPGDMCNYRVRLTSLDQVDDELIGWIRRGFEKAG